MKVGRRLAHSGPPFVMLMTLAVDIYHFILLKHVSMSGKTIHWKFSPAVINYAKWYTPLGWGSVIFGWSYVLSRRSHDVTANPNLILWRSNTTLYPFIRLLPSNDPDGLLLILNTYKSHLSSHDILEVVTLSTFLRYNYNNVVCLCDNSMRIHQGYYDNKCDNVLLIWSIHYTDSASEWTAALLTTLWPNATPL